MLAVFLAAATKAPTYLLPLYPFLALVIALSASSLLRTRFRFLAMCLSGVFLLCGGMLTHYNAYHHNPYYLTQLAMAVDEQQIGDILGKTDSGTLWYVYNDQNLGSIMFYSQHLSNILIASSTAIMPGALIVNDSYTVQNFATAFPTLKTKTAYGGPQVTLLQVE